jgi:hypothetical protein
MCSCEFLFHGWLLIIKGFKIEHSGLKINRN